MTDKEGTELTEWLQAKLVRAETALTARLQMQQTWAGGTNESWKRAGCNYTKAQRLIEAERQGRIAVKCLHDVKMIKALIVQIIMTEQKKLQLMVQYNRMEHKAVIERQRGFNRVADSLEESMARIEAEFQRNDCDINDYRNERI